MGRPDFGKVPESDRGAYLSVGHGPLLQRRGVLFTLCKDGWRHTCVGCVHRAPPCGRITYTEKSVQLILYGKIGTSPARCALKLVQTVSRLQ